ncbi:Fc.00g106230.m01.CDS01 [Cosmosporella sp. VM-42]
MFFDSLERRIQQLEAENRLLAAAAITDLDGTGAERTSTEQVDQHPRRRSTWNGDLSSANDDDVANEVSFLSTSAGGDRQFLGSTSGILLASLVKAGITVTANRPTEATSSSAVSLALPSKQLARGLVEAYLAHDHLAYPFLHPRAVRATVDHIYSDAGLSRTNSFEAFMLNMILAISTSQVYKFNWQGLPGAETHHQRATAYLNTVLCEGGLRALQAMLLLCQFRLSSSTKDASGSLWHIVGIAARMCFELGLHREAMYRLSKSNLPSGNTSCLSPTFEENKVRRRCFWSVFALDRVVSITLGRPLAIFLEDLDLELPTEDLDEETSPSESSTGDESWIAPSYRTALFVHLVRYRDICGRCLTSLHRGSRTARTEAELDQIRSNLAAELRSWRADTNSLNLPEIDLLSRLAEARSSFRSKAWYELLYHNGVLLLYRPSASTVSVSRDGASLQKVFAAAKEAITLYAYLLRSRKINFSWITMHAVFMAGLSYVFALSRHFREKRRRPHISEAESYGIPTQLAEEPTIVDIVNSCRACSNVLVAASERCNAQKNCHEVFDRLSDAVLADAVAALSGHLPPDISLRSAHESDVLMEGAQAEMTEAGSVTYQMPSHTNANSNIGQSAPSNAAPPLAVDNALRDCFPDLQHMYDAWWGDDVILQLSSDWPGEIDHLGNGLSPLFALASFISFGTSRGLGCPDISVWRLPGLNHHNATIVAAGQLKAGTDSENEVALCRVVGSILYGPEGNNTLNFELWLPEKSKYNGRYVSVGNGGFAGTIDYGAMMDNLNKGYAVGGGDGGHPTSENGQTKPGSFVEFFHDRAKVLAWIRNSIAMFTKPAKSIVAAFYGRPPAKMYYIGCSTGGAQGFALAQFHPNLFDGISAGCPGNWYSHLILSFLWNGLNSAQDGSFLNQEALDLITQSVLDECDTLDGVEDRVVANPARCSFDVTTLQCASDQTPIIDNKTVCLTKPQIDNVLKFYAGPTDFRNGKLVYLGFALGSESTWMNQEAGLYLAYAVPILQNLVFQNLSYDYKAFDWGADISLVDRAASPLIDHISPNLETFRKNGGKMIVTQGWADPYNAPFWPIKHREQMRAVSGDALDSFFSVFTIPGGGHCGSSAPYPQVPGTYHTLDRLVPWVERNEVPQDLVGTGAADGSNTTVTLKPYPRGELK